eukprot:gene10946-biopygen776
MFFTKGGVLRMHVPHKMLCYACLLHAGCCVTDSKPHTVCCATDTVPCTVFCYAYPFHAECSATDARSAQGLVLDIDKNKWWERLPFNPCSATGPSGTAV